jgi:hypothetical protein
MALRAVSTVACLRRGVAILTRAARQAVGGLLAHVLLVERTNRALDLSGGTLRSLRAIMASVALVVSALADFGTQLTVVAGGADDARRLLDVRLVGAGGAVAWRALATRAVLALVAVSGRRAADCGAARTVVAWVTIACR